VLPASEQLHTIQSGSAAVHTVASLTEKLQRGAPLRVKLGVDPTAPDLHLGHAVPLRKLRQFQDLGHTVVLIIGDYTALIGDPSGRSTTRPHLTIGEIDDNAQTYTDQAFRILDRERTELRRNSEWLGKLDFAGVLKYASQFTVARTLERDDFANRLAAQQPIALHELLYPVMQAYDSVVVEADIEIGGTDQLFNLLAGRELMEKLGADPQVALTLPLLEGTDGVQKMSKSYGNYIGLTDGPDDMFGKVMSIPDELMVKYFRLCTAVPVDDIDAIEAGLTSGDLHPNATKRRLAREIVELYHPRAAAGAEEAFDRVFKDRGLPDAVPELAAGALRSDLAGRDQGDVVFLPSLLADAGLVPSGSEGRRMIEQGGVKIDGAAVAPETLEVPWSALTGRVLQVGKRRFVRLP
jgi:tyrosyl-tRNA synthetase